MPRHGCKTVSGIFIGKSKSFFVGRYAVFALLAVVFIAYWNSLSGSFVWDDHLLIIGKQGFFDHPANALKILSSSDAPLGGQFPYYRPLNTLTYMADHFLWGLHPFWYHLENVLLHALVAVLFYILLMEVFKDERLAFISSVLFALYPVNTEAVDLISARNTILCAVFSLTSLWLLSKGGFKWTMLSLLAYFLALLSKEPAVVLPFFLVSFGFAAREERFKIKWNVIMAFWGITAVYFVLRHLVLGAFISNSSLVFSLSRAKLVLATYFKHFSLFVFPFKLNALYTEKQVSFSLYKGAMAIAGILFLLYVSLSRKMPDSIRAGAHWIFWGVLPVSNIVKIPSAPIADRFQYTILFGFVLILGYLLSKVHNKSAITGTVLVTVLAVVLGTGTFMRNFAWRNDFDLFSSMLRTDPCNTMALNGLGVVYMDQGRFGEASRVLVKAIRLDPDFSKAYLNLGAVYLKCNRLSLAEYEFKKAIALNPDYAFAHMDLGEVYKEQSSDAEAEKEFLSAIRLQPYYADSYLELGKLYLAERRFGESFQELSKAVALNSYSGDAHMYLGLVLGKEGHLHRAVSELKAAVRMSHGYAEAHMNLGMAYMKVGLMGQAAMEFQTALNLRPDYAEARTALESIAGLGISTQGK